MFHSARLRAVSWASLCCLACSLSASAQVWQVDPTPPNPGPNSMVTLEAESYADSCSNNNPQGALNCVDRPPPLPPFGNLGRCPPHTWPLLGWAGYPQWVVDRPPPETILFPNGSVFGPQKDLVAVIAADATDLSFFPNTASSLAQGFVTLDGLETRTLEIISAIQTSNVCNDDDAFTRGCAAMAANLSINAVSPPPNPYFIRYDWWTIGNASSNHECLDPVWAPLCAQMGLPPEEDPALAFCDVDLLITGFPNEDLVNGVLLENTGPVPPTTFGDDGDDALTLPAGQVTNVQLGLAMIASLTLQQPIPESSESDFRFNLNLHLIYHDFDPGEPFDSYMREVPVTGLPDEGPLYCFRVGRKEITNQQYADFLNSAEYDLGATELSSNMVFMADGRVTLPDGTLMFEPANTGVATPILYTPSAAVGARYTVMNPSGTNFRSNEQHPVVHVTWFGAAKFCNWLTMKRGLGAGQRCYNEGATKAEWHPVTISTADWATRDLNAAERLDLVTNYEGFRLPMDNLGNAAGHVGNQNNEYNEWYKAAALSPLAPNSVRAGPAGEAIPPYHWVYGFGRDIIGINDANFFNSSDPFDNDDAFVAMYNGTTWNPGNVGDVGNQQELVTNANQNPWEIYDLSGNVREWAQDQVVGRDGRYFRSGSWNDAADFSAVTFRAGGDSTLSHPWLGFRIVQAYCLPSCQCLGDMNNDNFVDGLDIQGFVDCLILGNPGTPACICADINVDGILNVIDQIMFVNLLVQPGSTQCP